MIEFYKSDAVIEELKKMEDIEPDQIDGSYELMRKTIEAYSNLKDYHLINYSDFYLLYLTSISTFWGGVEERVKTIQECSLPAIDKESLCNLWKEIDSKGRREKYRFYELGVAIPMRIERLNELKLDKLKRSSKDHLFQEFIRILIEIQSLDDEEQIFKKLSCFFSLPCEGFDLVLISTIMHLNKPHVFPLIDINVGSKSIYELIGIDLQKWNSITTYIDNCKCIKKYRDLNLSFLNYRIFDVVAKEVTDIDHIRKYGKWFIHLREIIQSFKTMNPIAQLVYIAPVVFFVGSLGENPRLLLTLYLFLTILVFLRIIRFDFYNHDENDFYGDWSASEQLFDIISISCLVACWIAGTILLLFLGVKIFWVKVGFSVLKNQYIRFRDSIPDEWLLFLKNNGVSLFGPIIGGFITMIGVVITIKADNKKTTEEKYDQARPEIFFVYNKPELHIIPNIINLPVVNCEELEDVKMTKLTEMYLCNYGELLFSLDISIRYREHINQVNESKMRIQYSRNNESDNIPVLDKKNGVLICLLIPSDIRSYLQEHNLSSIAFLEISISYLDRFSNYYTESFAIWQPSSIRIDSPNNNEYFLHNAFYILPRSTHAHRKKKKNLWIQKGGLLSKRSKGFVDEERL